MYLFLKRKIISTTIVLLISSCIVYSQNDPQSLFKEAKELSKQALDIGANIFSQSNFEKGTDNYKDAEDDLKSGGNVDKVKSKLALSIDYFKKSIETAKLINISFAELMKTRQLAINAGAVESNPNEWKDAESNFLDAVDEFNDKNMEKVKKYSDAAETIYKDAELKAIKHRYLNNVNASITTGEDNDLNKFAPITLKKSKQLAHNVETLLDANRYDTVTARNTAQQALYEVNHGIYMQGVFKKMIEQEKTWEDLVLSWEEPLIKIASEFNINPAFDNGYDNVTSLIVKNINDKRTAKEEEVKNNLKLKSDIAELNKSIEDYKTQIANVENEKAKLKTQLDESEKNAKLKESIYTMFLPSEAEIVRDGELMVIRLFNLIFPASKATLEPQYFNLLSKVEKAIRLFPNCTVVIEGHTDAQGDKQKNIDLSQARAEAVYQYLMANLGMDTNKISAIGYGATKPITNNTTDEGKARNRRIEIVINPHSTDNK